MTYVDEFLPLAFLPGFEINRSGEVRNASTGNLVKHREHPANRHITCVQAKCSDGIQRSSQVNVLLEETFGPGAAQALGLPAPDWTKVRVSRERAEKRRAEPKEPKESTGKRRCTDCDRATHNYRCERCWKKKRGYGFDDSGDEATVTAEARQRMLLNRAAEKREKKEGSPGGMDWFKPSSKYGKSPPASPPGEQKRLAPAMPAKGHAAQRPHPKGDFWMPSRKRTKETPVSKAETTAPQAKTYSQGEVARLAGIGPGNMTYALKLIRQGRADLPPNAQKVKETLDRLGINAETWTGMAARQEPARPQEIPTAPAPAPEEAFDHGPDALEYEPASPAPVPALEASEAREPEPAALESEPADLPGPLEQAFAQALADEDWRPEYETASDLDQAVDEALAQGARVRELRFPVAEERAEHRSACFDLAVETALRLAPVEALMEALKERLPHARVSIQL